MSTYVLLINWTEQGAKNFKDTTQRAQDFTNAMEKQGGRVREIVWTMGEYDLVSLVDAPDDETLAAGLLQTGALGNIRTKTMRAFTAEQMTGILDRTG
jgi:uncharacterized protein with GYD domain